MKKELRVAIIYTRTLENYTNALVEAGKNAGITVEPVWFSCAEKVDGMIPFPEFHVEEFDGLLMPGGGDIDPAFYGEENCGSNDPDIETDRCQFAMIDAFVKAGKPILGICKGHQLLNVYFGGNLYQDIPEKKDHRQTADGKDNRNIIHASEGSLLYSLYGETFAVNSSHHQAVKNPGRGMTVTARCQDGVIEALEHDTLPILAVQFHPERMDYRLRRDDTVAGGRIFDWFLHQMSQTHRE